MPKVNKKSNGFKTSPDWSKYPFLYQLGHEYAWFDKKDTAESRNY
jgi:hypothetical protein